MLSPSNVPGKAAEAAEYIESVLGAVPPVAVVLGSGWDRLASDYRDSPSVKFEDVPGLGRPGVPGHRGSFRVARTGGGPLLIQDGKLHCYEGYSPLEVSFPAWIMSALGIEILVILSAAGGLNPMFMPGDLMIVSDHIQLFGGNPLVGLSDREDRTIFVPGPLIYKQRWQDLLQGSLPPDTRCSRGVYVFVSGPSYETLAEVRMLRVLGGDAVGMSTAPEALTATYLGMEVAAMCCISNVVLPVPGPHQSHDTVLDSVRSKAAELDGFLESIASSVDMIG